MKAFQVTAPFEFGLAQVATTQPGRSEVKVDVAYAGICGSDLHIIHGQNAFVKFPRVTGHEFSGVVSEVGADVEHIKVGDRVCIDPVISCGTCYPCRINRPNVCTRLQVIGVHRDGGFSEQVCVPQSNVHRLPDSMSLSHAALVEPYSIALNVLDRMQPHPGDSLLIYGAGVIGLTLVQMARALGLTDITVTDVIDERLANARSLGATRTLNGKDVDVEATMREVTGGEGVPLIVDAACIPALMPRMVRLASPAGRIGLLGFSTTPTDLVQLEMISHRIQFDEMPAAIAMIENHPEQTRKVLVQVNSDHH